MPGKSNMGTLNQQRNLSLLIVSCTRPAIHKRQDASRTANTVAKHLVAKYGGKEAEDLFAAMPPFELIKSLLIKAVLKGDLEDSCPDSDVYRRV